MTQEARTKKEYDCICTTCGNTTKSFILTQNGGPVGLGKCGKCSKTSYPKYAFREWWLIEAMVKEMVELKSAIFDLECYVEEQVDPVGGEV